LPIANFPPAESIVVSPTTAEIKQVACVIYLI